MFSSLRARLDAGPLFMFAGLLDDALLLGVVRSVIAWSADFSLLIELVLLWGLSSFSTLIKPSVFPSEGRWSMATKICKVYFIHTPYINKKWTYLYIFLSNVSTRMTGDTLSRTPPTYPFDIPQALPCAHFMSPRYTNTILLKNQLIETKVSRKVTLL